MDKATKVHQKIEAELRDKKAKWFDSHVEVIGFGTKKATSNKVKKALKKKFVDDPDWLD